MNPAEAAEEAPSDPDTDAFYKTGRGDTCCKTTPNAPQKPHESVNVTGRRLEKHKNPNSRHLQKTAEELLSQPLLG
ncbi:hypothetical protein NQZ68_021681 [Dissostichus eleginoides]|nr:hypothetical protein NQZ68_021681 [Dissostichus eleginoides]